MTPAPERKETMSIFLEAAALFFAAIYFGATTYISLVEVPGRSVAGPDFGLKHWQYCMAATPRYAASALVAASAGLFVGKGHIISPWTVGSILLLLVLPLTAFALVPLQRKLASLPERPEDASTQKLIQRWSAFHNVRTLLGCASFLLFLYAVLRTH
jgi:Anthrone oxygenase